MAQQYDFDSFYETYLAQNLDELEKRRKKKIKRFRIVLLYSLPGYLIAFYTIAIVSDRIIFMFGVFLALGFTLVSFTQLKTYMAQVKPLYKKVVITPILKYLYEDIDYRPFQKISGKVLNESLLIKKKVQKTKGDDFVRCRIGQTHIMFSEVEGYAGSNEKMIYAGIFISATFNKTFKTKTIVLPSSFRTHLHKIKLELGTKMHHPQHIKLEDPNFNKEYIVIGEDQVESRYLLSTTLMERMRDYQNHFKGKVAFSFINNRIYISIPVKKNMFEARLFDPINDKSYIKYNYDYFKLLLDVVEELDLNNRIWL